MTAVMFFWDYDTQWGADRSRLPGARDWGAREFENTDEILDIHAEFSVPACFAVVGAAALPGGRPYHDPGQIRRIHAAGHEIASHSFAHDWLPALNTQALLQTLRISKDALEQCIGAPVQSFVPPFNQPFDYAGGCAFSLSERREAGPRRITLKRLCEALAETGYRFCRVAYVPLVERLTEWISGTAPKPRPPIAIAGITCVRTGSGGFECGRVGDMLRRAVGAQVVALYGHPHSLHGSDPRQSARALRSTLTTVASLNSLGAAECLLPRDLIQRRSGVSTSVEVPASIS